MVKNSGREEEKTSRWHSSHQVATLGALLQLPWLTCNQCFFCFVFNVHHISVMPSCDNELLLLIMYILLKCILQTTVVFV